MSEAIRQGDIPGVQLRCRRDLDRPADAVWRHLTEAAGQEAWICRRADVGPETMQWTGILDLEGDITEEIRVVRRQEPLRLQAALSQPGWSAATRLDFEVTPSGDGCELSVLQNGFEHLPLSHSLTTWEAYRRRWRAALERLANVG